MSLSLVSKVGSVMPFSVIPSVEVVPSIRRLVVIDIVFGVVFSSSIVVTFVITLFAIVGSTVSSSVKAII
jgi:hypothetical protein